MLKPLLAKFRIGRRIHRIEYEGLHTICFSCGKYGHRMEECGKDQGVGAD
jgi:hypothetical protein